jgi:uncharacterized protein involved in cysteine biosynthesis
MSAPPETLTTTRELALGFAVPWRGLRLLFAHKRLLGLAAATGGLALLVLTAVLYGAGWLSYALADRWLDGRLWTILATVGLFFALLPVSLLVFRLLSAMVCSFLNEALALAAERIFSPHAERSPDRSWVTELVLELRYELSVLPRTLKILVLALLLNFIPVLGQLLAAALTCWMAGRDTAHELLEVPFERRGLMGVDIDAELEERGVLWQAVGSATLLMAFVPVLNLLAMSSSIVGTSWLLAMLERDGHRPDLG